MCAHRPRGRRGAEHVSADATRPNLGNPALVAAAAAAVVTAAVGRGHSRAPAVVGMRGERGAGGWGERRGSMAMAATAFTTADHAVARRVTAPAFGGSLVVVRGWAVEKGVCGRRGIRRPLALCGARESGWRCRGAAWRVRGPLLGLLFTPSPPLPLRGAGERCWGSWGGGWRAGTPCRACPPVSLCLFDAVGSVGVQRLQWWARGRAGRGGPASSWYHAALVCGPCYASLSRSGATLLLADEQKGNFMVGAPSVRCRSERTPRRARRRVELYWWA